MLVSVVLYMTLASVDNVQSRFAHTRGHVQVALVRVRAAVRAAHGIGGHLFALKIQIHALIYSKSIAR
jgi:hypothetical protein